MGTRAIEGAVRRTAPRERGFGPFVLRFVPAAHPLATLEPLVAVVGLLGLVSLWLLPLEPLSRYVAGCSFHALTGLPCLTCGATRAVLALVALDLPLALRMNPALTLCILAGIAYTPVALWLWIARRPRPRIGIPGRGARWAVGGVVVALLLAQWVFLALDGR